MDNESKVRTKHKSAKCIHKDGVYFVLAWDFFFSVGPLLGSGNSRDEAWERAAYNLAFSDARPIDTVMFKAELFFRRNRGKKRGKGKMVSRGDFL